MTNDRHSTACDIGKRLLEMFYGTSEVSQPWSRIVIDWRPTEATIVLERLFPHGLEDDPPDDGREHAILERIHVTKFTTRIEDIGDDGIKVVVTMRFGSGATPEGTAAEMPATEAFLSSERQRRQS